MDLRTFTPTVSIEKSIFASLMFHLGENTELTMGGRQILYSTTKQVDSETIGGLIAVRNPNGLGACPTTPLSASTGVGGTVTGVPVGSTYAGTCDLLTAPGNGAPTLSAEVRCLHHLRERVDVLSDGEFVTTAAAWLAAGGPLGPTLCPSNSTTTTSPPWNFNLRGEYSHEVFHNGRAFVRGLFNYYPRNTNRQVSNISFVPDAYTILNLFVGLRSSRGDWEVSLSGRNILNNKTILSQGLNDGTLITPPQYSGVSPFGATSGYPSISFVQRREFSLNLRWAFGSR